MSDEQTRPGSEPPRSARGVNPRIPLGLTSHRGPIRHEWLYRIAPRITDTYKPYHDDNLGTQSAGNVLLILILTNLINVRLSLLRCHILIAVTIIIIL